MTDILQIFATNHPVFSLTVIPADRGNQCLQFNLSRAVWSKNFLFSCPPDIFDVQQARISYLTLCHCDKTLEKSNLRSKDYFWLMVSEASVNG